MEYPGQFGDQGGSITGGGDLTPQPQVLTPRWTPLRPHPVQIQLVTSPTRFKVVPAGRRSGKTERAKRKLVRLCLGETERPDARYFAAAPTRDQAKRIYWSDLKALTPRQFLAEPPRESDLCLRFITGAEIWVVGMDKPERIEGSPWDGGILDEFANMKPKAWSENVRPALSDRKGWCWFIGVPEGRNHYFDLYQRALEDGSGEWAAFTWPSSDILPPEEIERAKADLDELTYDQEYNASFLNFQGRAYYSFHRQEHCSVDLKYDPGRALIFCFDFNVSPGVAAVCQEVPQYSGEPNTYENPARGGTAVIGEVHIPRNSNTPAVCRKLVMDWKHHRGEVHCYGDATGGASGTAKVLGSDWDLIRSELRSAFADRLKVYVPSANPSERHRVNSVNTRLKAGNGVVRLRVNPKTAPFVVKDFEGVRVLEGGSGEIDKEADKALTHISDAIGYYVVYRFPVADIVPKQREFQM